MFLGEGKLSLRSDLNRRPTVYDTVALPAELRRHSVHLERSTGIEPALSAWEANVLPLY